MCKCEWFPIETAPRDGSAFLARSPDAASHGVMLIYSGADNDWVEEWSHHIIDAEPTHWMPLPPPPREQRDGAEGSP